MTKSKSISSKKKNELSLNDTEQDIILDHLTAGTTAYEVAKDRQISLKTLYDYLDKNPKFKDKFALLYARRYSPKNKGCSVEKSLEVKVKSLFILGAQK